MAETMGVGGLTGHLLVSTVVSGGVHVVSEDIGADVVADADRAAKGIAKQLAGLFAQQGWIAAEPEGDTSMMRRQIAAALALAVAALGQVVPAAAQQITGVPGSPSATTTIDGRHLPPPPPKFGGEIKLNAAQSKPWWPPRVVPPKGAPNVLLIMTDDVGFGAPSTFGGVIPTPALDRIAKAGLRYTNFHSTALCSPTRAALITGRNHHSVGLRRDLGAVDRLPRLQQHHRQGQGDHRRDPEGQRLRARPGSARTTTRPTFQASQAGPFDQWPTGMGFEYFYGFVGGDTSQWQPNLFRNTTPIYPYVGKPGWNLTTAMADDAIDWMKQLNEIDPEQAVLLSTTCPAAPTRRTTRRRSGSRRSATCICSTRAGTSCASRSSPTRRSSA